MKMHIRFTSLVLLSASALALPLAARAQDPKPEAPKPLDVKSKTDGDDTKVAPKTDTKKSDDAKKDEPIHIPLPQMGGEGGDDAHAEMKKLIGEVEQRMRQIDKLLAEAAAGESGAKDGSKQTGAGANGVGALVKRSQAEGQTVVKTIDKILELADHEHPGGGSCENAGGLCKSSGNSKGSPQQSKSQGAQQPGEQQGKSPLDGARDTTTQRESTPDKPGSADGKQAQGKMPDASGNPRGNKKSQEDAKNRAGTPPPGQEGEKVAHATDARDTWGFLPEHARDVFRTQGGGEMPARYREWIDAYYKKLNQKP